MRKSNTVLIILSIIVFVPLSALSCISSSPPEEPQRQDVEPVQPQPTVPQEVQSPPPVPPPTQPSGEIPPMYSEEEILTMVEERLLGFTVDPFMGPREIMEVECFVDAYDPKLQEWSGRCFLWVEDYNTYITASWTLSEESGDIAIRGHFREGEYHIPSP